jgi:hypothetical protein
MSEDIESKVEKKLSRRLSSDIGIVYEKGYGAKNPPHCPNPRAHRNFVRALMKDVKYAGGSLL